MHGARKEHCSAHFCLLSVGFSLEVEERGLDKTSQKRRERFPGLNVKLISVKSVISK